MNATTLSIINLVESLGKRQEFLEDITPLVAEKVFYTQEQLAERYTVSLSTVKKWRADGLLTPSLKISEGTARYTLADLVEFENKRNGKKGGRVGN